ncbi:MAG TPA: alkaline phosphatase [Planctomycetaceae bacterium]|nr:alkaline phosphatase [Planctomycetaceae bacterium]
MPRTKFRLIIAAKILATLSVQGAVHSRSTVGQEATSSASGSAQVSPSDRIAALQAESASTNQPQFGRWGPNPEKYSTWTTHSNRLVPIYSFGGNLEAVAGQNSVYRSEAALNKLYGKVPDATLNKSAEYFDQTDVYRLQKMAVKQGKKRIILMVFDGMDWDTTRAAAIAKQGKITYDSGRGTGLDFLDYQVAPTDFGYFVSSPHNNGTSANVDDQSVTNPGGKTPGGYDPRRAGYTPWDAIPEATYPISTSENPHAYTDSAASATSMTAGIKTYNNAINMDFSGREVVPLARDLQEQGFAIGVVTSVPISHATPACAYANNVHRNDYQDLTRDLLGLPSVTHPGSLPGVDVLLGAGHGVLKESDGGQGKNFEPGNRYLAPGDEANVRNSKEWVVAMRTAGKLGSEVLTAAASSACDNKRRLFGFFGVAGGHLPYQTANGDYKPVRSVGNASSAAPEVYSRADVDENVTLSEMTTAALDVLAARSDRWWLMIEAGDVDWANHSNNIDNSIGAVLSGELAFHEATRWIESHGGWDDTLLLLTADHGHYLVLDNPELLAGE